MNAPLPPLSPFPAVECELVQALRDLADVLSTILPEFTDPADRALLYASLQGLVDVALRHDARGDYQVYAALGADDEPATDHRSPGGAA